MFDVEESKARLRAAVTARRELADLTHSLDVQELTLHPTSMRLVRSISRAVDLFDDGYQLYTGGRLTSAMVVSRSFVEQVAYTARIRYLSACHASDPSELEDKLTELDNSSEQRRRLFKEDFDPDQMYTDAALAKIGSKTPATAPAELISSLQWALTALGDTEGKARLMYSALSEWTHPTLFSVVHCYTKNVPSTPTSAGKLSVNEVRHSYIRWSLTQMLLLYLLWTTRGQQALTPLEPV